MMKCVLVPLEGDGATEDIMPIVVTTGTRSALRRTLH
jgi:hypothetical protein